VCKFNQYFAELFDTNKTVHSNHPPYANLSVWEGNRLCPGKDNGTCEFKPEHRLLSYTEPNYAIGKAYGTCTTLGIIENTLCTEEWVFEDGSTLLTQGVVFNGVKGYQELVVLGGTGCFKFAEGTILQELIVDPHTKVPLYYNYDIAHVAVPEEAGLVLY